MSYGVSEFPIDQYLAAARYKQEQQKANDPLLNMTSGLGQGISTGMVNELDQRKKVYDAIISKITTENDIQNPDGTPATPDVQMKTIMAYINKRPQDAPGKLVPKEVPINFIDPNTLTATTIGKTSKGAINIKGNMLPTDKPNQQLLNRDKLTGKVTDINGSEVDISKLPRDSYIIKDLGNERSYGQKEDQWIAKNLKLLGDDIDPTKNVRNSLGIARIGYERAERLEALIKSNPTGNLDKRQIEEVAIGLNSMLQGSNVSAQEQVKQLVPQSFLGSVQKIKEYITNIPTGLQQQEFVKRLGDTVGREKQTMYNQFTRAAYQKIAKYPMLEEKAYSDWENLIKGYGVDPTEYKQWRKSGSQFQDAVPSNVIGTQGQTGKIRVQKGNEILEIDSSDEQDAIKDGYKRIQ